MSFPIVVGFVIVYSDPLRGEQLMGDDLDLVSQLGPEQGLHSAPELIKGRLSEKSSAVA
jgi:hypothetical protein